MENKKCRSRFILKLVQNAPIFFNEKSSPVQLKNYGSRYILKLVYCRTHLFSLAVNPSLDQLPCFLL